MGNFITIATATTSIGGTISWFLIMCMVVLFVGICFAIQIWVIKSAINQSDLVKQIQKLNKTLSVIKTNQQDMMDAEYEDEDEQ